MHSEFILYLIEIILIGRKHFQSKITYFAAAAQAFFKSSLISRTACLEASA